MKKIILITLSVFLLATTVMANNLPKLIDIGADKCIPCIKMAPILEQLKDDFSGQMEVEFIDAWKNRNAAASYGIRMIPTQIFFAANGDELYRHTGFYSRDEILDKWQELGYQFTGHN
ncbi:thioredoxin 1 [Desulfuromusa kysingii]|uniref:Thioredoxin 1 n=1 Tax=Desulfuromusa kysingii TaxID=37625 RepID=A0A1H4B8B1_9BACT|nr:thioredoxin family protein [Desulfuromusa kysingii]SEA44403.1 thioredoxin 1 [Desulfuromusa kysingii]